MRERLPQSKAMKGEHGRLHRGGRTSAQGPVQKAALGVRSKCELLEMDSEKGTLGTCSSHTLKATVTLSSVSNECVEKLYEHLGDKEWGMETIHSSVVRFNVRGVRHMVDRDVLMAMRGTYFESMLRSDIWRPQSDGTYFIDRSPENFQMILKYMKSGVIDFESLDAEVLSDLLDDLDYYQIPLPVKRSEYRIGKSVDGHKGPVYSLAQLHDGRVCSGSYDCSIRVWDDKLESSAFTLQGHSSAVMALLVLKDGSLWSASADYTIKSWDLIELESHRTITGHTNVVSSLIELEGRRLCSASWDTSIKIWGIDDGLCLKTLEGHQDWVVSLTQLEDGLLCSGSTDKTVRLWDTLTASCLKVIQFSSAVLCLAELSAGTIVCGLRSGLIESVDILTQSRIHCDALDTQPSRFTVVLEDGRLCTSGGKEQSMQLWGWNHADTGLPCMTREPMSDVLNFGMLVSLLQLNDGSLCGGGALGSIAIWE